jgi:hypothetical protein
MRFAIQFRPLPGRDLVEGLSCHLPVTTRNRGDSDLRPEA